MTRTDTVQVISRAAAVLRVCRDSRGGLSLADIASRAGLPRSTVQRIVRSLASEGLLVAGGTAGSIRLGPEIQRLAVVSRIDIVELAHPLLKELSARLGETVDLAVLRGDHMVFIDQIAGSQRLRAVSGVGETFPLHCTANGKAALALLSDDGIKSVCSTPLRRFTPSTITSIGRLMKDIVRVRAYGVAVDKEEHSAGICAVGAALDDGSGTIHAVSVPMPSVRFSSLGGDIEVLLRQTMTKLSIALVQH